MAEKHWGIWIASNGNWMTLNSGGIFWTSSHAAAKAQLRQSSFADDRTAQVRCYEEWEEWYGSFSEGTEQLQSRD